LTFSEAANHWTFSLSAYDVPYGTLTKFTYLGTLIAGLLSVYFLKACLKEPLVIFTLVYLLSLILLRFSPTTQSEIYLAAMFFKYISYFGIILTILAILITAKLDLKSFLIAILIIWFWKSIGEVLGSIYSYANFDFEFQNLGLQFKESEGDIKYSVQEAVIGFGDWFSYRFLSA